MALAADGSMGMASHDFRGAGWRGASAVMAAPFRSVGLRGGPRDHDEREIRNALAADLPRDRRAQARRTRRQACHHVRPCRAFAAGGGGDGDPDEELAGTAERLDRLDVRVMQQLVVALARQRQRQGALYLAAELERLAVAG